MRRYLAAGFVAVLALALAEPASAYYHWVYFLNRTGPFEPVREHFDLSKLSDQTVPYLISNQGPSPMVDGDSFDSLVSQIRRAADTWNHVPTSTIKLGFGGLGTIGVEQSAPGIDVVFDDEMPPGLLAQSRPETYKDLSFLSAPDAPKFAPILRARLQLRRDLTTNGQASWSDAFFLTIVHEFGHTLGLQHSMTSAVMSTSITRATTKSLPLSADDIAGLSLLYPTAAFQASTGVITGRVSIGSQGVNLASVVALSANGAAIGSVSNPDGSYRIEGLPPGDYYIYTHPLPPAQTGEQLAAGINLPADLNGNFFPATTAFDTRFFTASGSGTKDWKQATQVPVGAGQTTANVNFQVQAKSTVSLYNLRTYVYLGPQDNQVPLHAPPVISGSRVPLILQAPGTTVAGAGRMVPNLKFEVIGNGIPAALEPETLTYWQSDLLYIALDTAAVDHAFPVALAVSTPDDLYILPAAFSVVPVAPPLISGIDGGLNPQGDGTAVIHGKNLSPSTRILFDGRPAVDLRDNGDGSLLATAPPAAGQHLAVVEALDGFGQTANQLLGVNPPPRFTYTSADLPSIAVTPGEVTAGTDLLLQIDGSATSFQGSDVALGFGLSDITLRQVWVVNRNRLLANVSIGNAAQTGPVTLTLASGLQLVTLNTALVVHPAAANQISMFAPVLNQATGLAGVPAGGIAHITAAGLPQDLTGWRLTIGGTASQFRRAGAGELASGEAAALMVQVPSDVQVGVASVRLLRPDGTLASSIGMQIDAPPPLIRSIGIVPLPGAAAAQTTVFRPGQTIRVSVAGLTEAGAIVQPSDVSIHVGNVVHPVLQITPGAQFGVLQLDFVLGDVPAGKDQPLTVWIGTRVSAPMLLEIGSRAATDTSTE